MRLAVNPTRMELLRLRKRLAVARRGHKLLKDKLDGLMKDFGEYAKAYKERRLAVDEQLPRVLKYFVLAEATSSRAVTEDALDLTRQDLVIETQLRRVMGVAIPHIEVSFGEVRGGYSLMHTSPELDSAIDSLKKFIPELLHMSELEQTVRLLSQEIEKTRRRVNALEHTLIPNMAETIKFIKSKLDEMERSTTSQLMKIKADRMAEGAM
ncbi:MAG TPA: V-type ATP synthase subunit D [Candidatus Hydrogenedentes bacterium]|jgi:V/A-type H+-transporting ATPase subunit D|nr:V-type ATP synthase subunit D [Candidatus Hydrogenedentota bacterium]MDY0031502.1 V-type ATP synthase subunit D [FCB group bacterium]NLT61563.1 V-type ATP synthase subunit D [Candidatus Hydrogenedentota bacterium]HNV21058.1 V-type ATP synthase subunit D [Candidatus Hydrogenedentota bacterium]HNZ17144.1 V-type ATP synthase subunit D [Candidatus Hydrogenedentota bacterium]